MFAAQAKSATVGAAVVGAAVVGAAVVGATVAGATVTGATVAGATVFVGATVVALAATRVQDVYIEPARMFLGVSIKSRSVSFTRSLNSKTVRAESVKARLPVIEIILCGQSLIRLRYMHVTVDALACDHV